jgi:diguanylate cyclase (GGDEF)-like protein
LRLKPPLAVDDQRNSEEHAHVAKPGKSDSQELQRLRQRNDELEILFDTIRDLISTLSVHEVMERLLDRTLKHLDAEIGSILVSEPDDSMRIMLARGLPENVVEETRVRRGEGISGYVAENNHSLLVEDVEHDERFQRRNRERYYTNSFISAPLSLHGSVRGVINVNNKRNRDIFVYEDLKLLEALAGHAVVALANAHRYEEALVRAQRDSLTGLANHGHFWSSLDLELQRASRYERYFSVVMIDVDHFKDFNDRFGHMAGDEVLMRVSKLIAERCRANDLAARYGGEEFAILLPETCVEGAVAFSEKIRMEIEKHSFGPNQARTVTVSAGLACYPEDGNTTAEIIKTADAHLYRAKSEGRTRVCSPR